MVVEHIEDIILSQKAAQSLYNFFDYRNEILNLAIHKVNQSHSGPPEDPYTKDGGVINLV